jgi:hypothetical protein
MSHSPSLYVLNLAVPMSDADPKVVKVILERGTHFTSRSVAG